MPTIVQTFQGRVTGLWGTANLRGADGKMHPLHVGDLVHKGDVILTSQDGIVQLTPDDTSTAQAAVARAAEAAASTPEIDRVISGLNEPNSADATAAGVNGGDGAGDLTPGLRVERISEATTPAGLNAPGNDSAQRIDANGAAAQQQQQPNPQIDAASTTIRATEEGPAVALNLTAPSNTDNAAVITVTQLPQVGQLQKADGTPVGLGSVLTSAELTGLKYLPPADYNAGAPTGQFTYTVNDRGQTVTGGATIELGTVNDAPVGRADTASTLEDTPVSGNVLANDSDADGDALRVTQYSIAGVSHAAGTSTTLAGIGTLVMNADGGYTFTPAANYNGPVPTVTYTLTDGTVSSSSTLTLAVTPVNDAPIAAADLASTPINVPVTVAVLANDKDVDGDALTVTGATLANPGQGTVVVNPDGTVTFTPASNTAGPVVITYTVSDGHGGTGSSTLTVNVGSNTPPTGADAVRSTAEDTAYVVKTGDFGFADADGGQTLANVRIDTLPGAGTLLLGGAALAAGTVVSAADIAAGKLVFVPVADGNGSPYAQFTFSVQDSAGAFDAAPNTLTVNVTPVNDAPVAVGDTATGLEDTPITGNVLANDKDVDGDVLHVSQFVVGGTTYAAGSVATLAGVGTLVIQADGSYTFTPAANYNGPVPVATYTATDGSLTSTATLTLALTPVNDAPVAAADIASTPINTPVVIAVLANDKDVDGDPLTVTGATLADPAQGTVGINPDGTLSFTPAGNVSGPVTITYTISDGHGGTASTTVTVNVGNNTPPTGADSVQAIAEDSSYVVKTADFGFADADAGQTLANVRIDTLPAAGALLLAGVAVHAGDLISAADVAAGKLVFVPAADGNGSPYASFGFSVQDSAGAFDTAPNTLTVNVTPVNDAPVANADTGTATEDTPLNGNVLSNDTDVDGNLLQVTQFTVGGANYAAGSTATLAGVGSLQINTDGSYTFTPAANYNGPVPVVGYTVTDGSLTASSTLTINVTPVNDAPVANADTGTATEDTPLAGNVLTNDTDVDGDTLHVTQFTVGGTTYTAGSTATLAGIGTLQINADGSYAFTPAANYNGAVPVATYTITDGSLTSSSTLAINVTPVNDAPVANVDTGTATEDTPLNGNVLTNDTDVDGNVLQVTQFSVAGTTYAAGSTATLAGVGTLLIGADGSYTFSPATNYNGPVPVATYTVTDGALTATSTLTINVTPVNDAPVANADTGTATEDTPLNGNVLANDTDIDGDVLQVTQFSVGGTTYIAGSTATLVGVGTLQVNADGSYTFSPAANYNGAVPVATYTVTDGSLTATSTLTINVTPVNDAPVANADTATATEDTPLNGNVLTNDTDVDGNVLHVTQFAVGGTTYAAGSTATLSGIGTLLINADGSYTFSPAANYNGPVPVATYTITDGALTSSSTLAINVTPVNDAPVAHPDTGTAIEDQPLVVDAAHGLLANDNDVDGDALHVTQFSVGGNTYVAGATAALAGVGTLLINADGSYTFTPNLYYNGPVPVATYTITDGSSTSTSTLTLGITPVNHAPTLSLDDDHSHNIVSVQAIGGLFNTGQGADGAAIALGATDAHYTLASAPAGTGASNTAVQLNYAWLHGDANSTWIGSTADEQTGTYVYQTSFTLQPGADPRSVLIGFDLASDNNLRDILVNGVSTGIASNVQYSSFVHFELNGMNAAFGSGVNTISFVVDNRDTVTDTTSGPTGLLIDNMSGTVAVIGASGTSHVGDYATIYVEGSPVSISDIDTRVSDVDGPTLQSATITLTNAQAGDVLLAGGLPAGIVASFDSSGTVLTLSGAASQSAYQQAIHAIQFSNTTDNPSNAVDRLITVVVNDGQLDSNVVTTTVHVVPVDAAPTLDLDAGDTTAPGTGYAGTYHDSGPGVAVVGTNDLIADTDSAQIHSATVHISNVQAGDTLSVGSLPAGISAAVYDPSTGLLNLSGAASLADYQAALHSVVFSNTGSTPSAVTRTIEITVNDGTANSNVAVSQISVIADGHAPVAVADTATVTQDTVFASAAPGVLANDTDVDSGDSKTVSAVSFGATTGTVSSALSGTYGTLTLNADGSYTYLANQAPAQALAAGQTATEQFSYTMKDAAGATSSTTLAFTITGTNDAPVAHADAAVAIEDTPFSGNVLANDTDVDGDALHVTQFAVGGATYAAGSTATLTGVGTLQINADGSYAFAPAANYNGAVPAVTYTTTDGSLTSSSTLAINVTPVNDAPVANADTGTATEDTPLNGNVLINDGDVDGNVLQVTQFSIGGTTYIAGSTATLVGVGTLLINTDGSYTFTPAANYNGAVPVASYTVSDGALTASSTLTIGITPVNDAPVANADTGTATEDTPLNGNVLNNDADVDGNALHVTQFAIGGTTYTAGSTATLAGVGTLQINADGSYAFSPAANYNGAVPAATYTITDGSLTASSTLTINVTPVNDAPVANPDTASATEAGGVGNNVAGVNPTGNVLGNDTDVDSGDTKTVSAVSGAAAGNVGGATAGSYGSLLLNADGSYTYTLNNANASVQSLRTAGDTLTDTFTYTVKDAAGATSSTTLTVTIHGANDAPVAVVDSAVATEDVVLRVGASGGVLANDTDVDAGDTKTVSAVSFGATAGSVGSALSGTYGTLTLNTDGSYSYLANKAPAEALAAGQTATEQFTYTTRDAAGATASTTLTFTITGTNDAPVNQAPGNQTTAEDTPLVFSAANGNAITVADVDTPNLTVTLSSTNGSLTLGSVAGVSVSGNGTGTVTLSGSSAAINAALNGSSYKAVADYNGTAQLTVSTSDGTAPAVVSTIGLTVAPVVDIHADSATTFESQAVTIDVNANDTFSNAGHVVTAINGVAIVSGGSVAVANGSVALQADGTLVFTPTSGYNTGSGAPTSFNYTVASGGVSETANVDVTVTPVNNAAMPTLSVTPIGRWTFNEGAGSPTTDAYNAHTGSLSDSTPSPTVLPTWTTGHVGTSGSALQFDGAGSYVALDAATTQPLMGTSSLSFWIKTTQVGNNTGWNAPAVIASEQAGGTNDIQWGTLNANGQIGFDVGNAAGLYSTTKVNDDAWHQVAITRDASTNLVKVYVDGLLEATGSPTDAGFNATLNRLAGFGATNNFSNNAAGSDLTDNNFLKASLDDVRIYDHVLTSDQVAAIKSVEAGYHNLAVANDGDATKLSLAATNYTALSVSGLNAGMVITDGTAAHTVTSSGTDSVIDMTGWNTSSVSISGSGTGSATLIFNATDTVGGESHTATQYLNLVNGTTLLAGGAGNDTLNATSSASLLVGNDGNDTLNGGAGHDRLLGGAGNDVINGGGGNDIIYGGSGNDSLTGGAGADVFAWRLADRGSAGSPATDQVTDFNLTSSTAGGDSIDLRDLLIGANHVGANAGNLQNYLDFDTTSTPGSTIVHVSSTGGFTGGNYSAAAEDQRIVLQGVDVRSPGAFGLTSTATDNDVIHQLLQRGKLVTDGP